MRTIKYVNKDGVFKSYRHDRDQGMAWADHVMNRRGFKRRGKWAHADAREVLRKKKEKEQEASFKEVL